MPIFVSSDDAIHASSKVATEPPTAFEMPKAESIADSPSEAENRHQMVMHNGALIDIEKLLQQLNRSEKAREEAELRLFEVNKSHTELQSSNSRAKDKIKDLQSELKSCNRKMNDAESSLSSANVSSFSMVTFVDIFENNFSRTWFDFRKSPPNTIRCCAVFRIRSVRWWQRVNAARQRKSHRSKWIVKATYFRKFTNDFFFSQFVQSW